MTRLFCLFDTVILTSLFNSLLLVIVIVSYMNHAFNQTVTIRLFLLFHVLRNLLIFVTLVT